MIGITIRMFLVDGEPDGLRIAWKSHSSGRALHLPRAQFVEKRDRDEFGKPGVYALINPTGGDGERPSIYIGESDELRTRLKEQMGREWTHVVAFVGDDLNKAHVKYLEAELYQLADRARTWSLQNEKRPKLPNLSDADRADAQRFLEEMLVLFPLFGVNAFEQPEPIHAGQIELQLSSEKIEARGYETTKGFVVRAGSYAKLEHAPSLGGYSGLKEDLIDGKVLAEKDGRYVLTQDYVFTSPSIAASIFLGRRANGRVEWRTSDGVTLREIQEGLVS